MNLGEAAIFLAVGFVPTLIALEMMYRMAKRSEGVEKFQDVIVN
jgi:hypothetical protein